MKSAELVAASVHEAATCVTFELYPGGGYAIITPTANKAHYPQNSITVKNTGDETCNIRLTLLLYGSYALWQEEYPNVAPREIRGNSEFSHDMPDNIVWLTLIVEVLDGKWKQTDTCTYWLYPGRILTVDVNNPEAGTTDPQPGKYLIQKGQTATVTASPNPGYRFAYWLLDGQQRTENPINVTMDSDHNLTAYFFPETATLTVNVNNPTLGTTDSNYPPGTYTFERGTEVTVTAIPYENAVFDHWEYNSSLSTENPIKLIMDRNYTLTAFFKPLYTLTVQAEPPDLSLGTTDANYPPGEYKIPADTTVTVTAIPTANATLDHWELDGATVTPHPSDTINVTMDKDHTLKAVFTPTHTLTVDSTPSGVKFKLYSSAGLIGEYTTPFTQTLKEDTYTVEYPLTHTDPATGHQYSFTRAEYDTNPSDNTVTFKLDRDISVKAYYQLITQTLTLKINNPTYGKVKLTSPTLGTVECTAETCTYTEIPKGEQITAEAIPYTGYYFEKWTINTTETTQNPYTFTMDKDYTLTANFTTTPPPEYAELTGVVKGIFGWKVAGAKVTLDKFETTTDKDGKYTFTNIPLGTYIIMVQHPLYMPYTETIALTEAKTYQKDITLTIKPIIPITIIGAFTGIVTAIKISGLLRRR